MREEVAWAAGLFEGEGHFTKHVAHGAVYAAMGLNMCDRDAVETFYRIVGVGSFYVRPMHDGIRQTQYVWKAHNYEAVQAVIAMFWPWLKSRRRARAKEVLLAAQATFRRYKDRPTCKHGHPFDEANTYRWKGGARHCRACTNRRGKEYRERRANLHPKS